MPICFDHDQFAPSLVAGPDCLRGQPPVEFREADANCLEIGLINNMPDPALEATERQFVALLDSAADGDRKSTRLNSSHPSSSYAVFCLKKKTNQQSQI